MANTALIDRLRDPSDKTLGVLMLAPAFILLALIVVYPIGRLIWNSFFDLRLSGGNEARFVGFENYAMALQDHEFWNATANTVLITLITVPGALVVGLGLAGCVPQFFSAAGNVDPRHGAAIIARVTGMGYVALLSGPSVIGLLTHWVPLTTAFLVPLALCLVASALAPRALRTHA